MRFLRQVVTLLWLNLSQVGQRLGPVLTIFIGVTCAVGVLVSMLAMGRGARQQELANVQPDGVAFMTSGARFGQSSISREEVTVIRSLPGIRRGADGEPLIVLESLIPIEAQRTGTGQRTYFLLTGVSDNILRLRPEIHFTDGRMFKRGLQELAASNACTRLYGGFRLGDHRSMHGGDWTVVGHFNQGDSQQCEVLADVNGVMSSMSISAYGGVIARLQSPDDFERLHQAVTSNPSVKLDVVHEKDALNQAFEGLNHLLDFVSNFVGTIMALGATLGAVNSLYALVDSRRRELATLRAIGFGPGAVVLATLIESILLAVPGAVAGTVLSWLFFNGLSASPFGYSFQLAVTPALASVAVTWALVMGFVGGLLPAVRAARIPVTTALRAT